MGRLVLPGPKREAPGPQADAPAKPPGTPLGATRKVKVPRPEPSELDRLRALHVAEQQATAPAPATRPGKPTKGSQKAGSPKGRGRPRTGARVAAVQALYQSEQTNEPAEVVISQFLNHRLGAGPANGGFEDGRVPEAYAPLFSEIVTRVARDAAALDAIIATALDRDWPLAKLDPVLRALLRAACGELSGDKATPAKVVINEYLDIAHGFFGGEEPRFANGVLNAMARALRAEEFAAAPRPAGR